MDNIININKRRDMRRQFAFKVRLIQDPNDQSRKLPIILLYLVKSGILVRSTGLERYYLGIGEGNYVSTQTLRKKANCICCFLNYLLLNTNINSFTDLAVKHLQGFLDSFKKTHRGNNRNPDEWERGVGIVYEFLAKYLRDNYGPEFKIDEKMLYRVEEKVYKDNKSYSVKKNNYFGIQKPSYTAKKNRVLLEEYLEMLIYSAEKHDQMIALAMALQAYAGLREGEVVNLTRGSLRLIYGGYGRIKGVDVDLTDEAAFAKNWNKKTDFGSIKVHRIAQVYPDFIDIIINLLKNHEDLLDELNADKVATAPLFLNQKGEAMSVDVYTKRVKKLFYDHFLIGLKKMCITNSSWAINAPYIEAYERDYPGAHMFRHWFTLYLIKYATVTFGQDLIDTVAYWRGDKSREAMEDYLHFNADMVSIYKDISQKFQRDLWDQIL